MKSPLSKHPAWVAMALVCILGIGVAGVAFAANKPLKKGLKVFVIPKHLGNSYFTTADSVKTGGALLALKTLGETGSETSGNDATAASQIPAIQAAISKGANALDRLGDRPEGDLPDAEEGDEAEDRRRHLRRRRADVPQHVHQPGRHGGRSAPARSTCWPSRSTTRGKIAIVSAAASAPNQNAWIGFMKKELKKFPKMKLVSTVYGNDDPTKSTQVTQGLLQKYPDLKGIISPTTVGILAAAQVVSGKHLQGKVIVTGLGTPLAMKKYVLDGTVPAFELWNPADLGYLAALRRGRASPRARSPTPRARSSRPASSATTRSASDNTVLLGKPFVFDKSNVSKFKF